MAEIVLLGCGTPVPRKERFGTSFLVRVGDDHLLFDCGPATTYKLIQSGYLPGQIDHLFFTHHHFDHNVDYPCFILTRWDQGAGKIMDLKVYGPSPTERITDLLIGKDGAFCFDWKARINHPLSLHVYKTRGGVLPRHPPRVLARDIRPGKVLNGRIWEVTAGLAEHVQPYLDSLAYRIDSSEGSVVITGDTRPCRSVVDLARGADVILQMCDNLQRNLDGNPMGDAMCGTASAARMAKEAEVRKLVLVHMGHELEDPEVVKEGMREVQSIYDGEIILGRDLMVISS